MVISASFRFFKVYPASCKLCEFILFATLTRVAWNKEWRKKRVKRRKLWLFFFHWFAKFHWNIIIMAIYSLKYYYGSFLFQSSITLSIEILLCHYHIMLMDPLRYSYGSFYFNDPSIDSLKYYYGHCHVNLFIEIYFTTVSDSPCH